MEHEGEESPCGMLCEGEKVLVVVVLISNSSSGSFLPPRQNSRLDSKCEGLEQACVSKVNSNTSNLHRG